MGTINTGRNRVTDKEMLNLLQTFSDILKRNIEIVKGEVIYPKGYDRTDMEWFSDVCIGFKVEGLADLVAYQQLKIRVENVFSKSHSYRVVLNGKFSQHTPGIYIHLYKNSNGNAEGKVAFFQYGIYAGVDYLVWEERFAIVRGRLDSYFDSIRAQTL